MKEIKDLIVNTNCIQYGNFTFSDGSSGNYYCDLRKIISYPKELKKVCFFLSEKIINSNIQFDYLVGLPTCGLVFSTLAAYYLNKPLLYIRKNKKKYGTQNHIEGVFDHNKNVIIIDDLINTENSKINAINVLNKNSLNVKAVFVILDRRDNEKKVKNIPVISLINKDILFKE